MIRWLYFTVQAKLRLIFKRVSVRYVWNNVVLLLSNNLRRTKAIYVKVMIPGSQRPIMTESGDFVRTTINY